MAPWRRHPLVAAACAALGLAVQAEQGALGISADVWHAATLARPQRRHGRKSGPARRQFARPALHRPAHAGLLRAPGGPHGARAS